MKQVVSYVLCSLNEKNSSKTMDLLNKLTRPKSTHQATSDVSHRPRLLTHRHRRPLRPGRIWANQSSVCRREHQAIGDWKKVDLTFQDFQLLRFISFFLVFFSTFMLISKLTSCEALLALLHGCSFNGSLLMQLFWGNK